LLSATGAVSDVVLAEAGTVALSEQCGIFSCIEAIAALVGVNGRHENDALCSIDSKAGMHCLRCVSALDCCFFCPDLCVES